MSKANPSVAPKPAHHTKMLNELLAKGFIKRIGDSYEITQAGHEYTCALTAAYPSSSTFEGNEHD
jgi:hypothetical protein